MFTTIIDICKSVIDYILEKKQIDLDTRLRISSILFDLHQIIQDTADKLKIDVYPHSNCVVMERLSNNLHLILIDVIESDKLDKLHSLLIQASQIEKQFAERENPETIINLEKVSGEFLAMSLILKR